jgi:putative transposase
MFRISKDTPALYFTSVAAHRLPVFRTGRLKDIACAALDEARRSGNLLLFAYVIMPDHLHGIVSGNRKQSEIMRFINGITSRRVIDYLKANGHASSLEKLRQQEKARRYRYSLWEHHSNTMFLTSEAVFMQRVNYFHNNPVRADLVTRTQDYRWSSARWWKGVPVEDEPLKLDLDQIAWRMGKA